MHLNDSTRVLLSSGAAAAGTTAINGAVIDTATFNGLRGLLVLGDVTDTAVISLKYQSGTLADGSDMADVTGATVSFTATATSADSKVITLEVVKPVKRYGRFVVTRGTANAAVLGLISELYGTYLTPVTGGDVIASKIAQG